MSLPGAVKAIFEKAYTNIPLGIKYGRVFRQTYRLLTESLTWSRERIEQHQFDQLRTLIVHAYRNVPFYKRRFDACGIDPYAMKDFDDIGRIPVLTREDIVAHLHDMTAGNMPSTAGYLGTTGGSSGAPLSFYTQRRFTRPRELAFNWFYWNRMDLHYRDTLGILRGGRLKDGTATYEFVARHNFVLLNSYQLSLESYPRFVEAIRNLGVDYIRAYPSTVVLLAKYMCDKGVALKMKAVLTSSENLYDADRVVIGRAFGCKVYDLYGQSECVVHIAQCERCDLYHVNPLYGYTELLDTGVGGHEYQKRIIGTSFNNYFMPLIRYETGDLCEHSHEACKCGFHHLTVKRIVGREREYVATKSGKIVTLTALVFAQHFDAFNRVLEMQIVQDVVGALTVKVVPKGSFSSQDEREIVSKMTSAAGGDIDIHVESVKELERTGRGKKPFLLQRIGLPKRGSDLGRVL